jgi:hypothetical protein
VSRAGYLETGSARGEGVVEYWGETDKGYVWRCHLETPEAES